MIQVQGLGRGEFSDQKTPVCGLTPSAETDIVGAMMQETSRQFKALSDETRLRIMALLLNAGELCVCDLTDTLQLPQSTVSRHLAYLRKSGLVRDRREGLWMYYSIERQAGFGAQLADFLSATLPTIPAAQLDLKRLETLSGRNRCN